MTATVRGLRPGEGDRSFQYAPLSSGLDIVRKTLGQHEIATMQTTDIDQPSGMVNLTTTLAHSSGEWIASDWPVCRVAELANPQRMGLALTYARRYALFTLAGIAGEDDLDAPDLCVRPNSLFSSRVEGSPRAEGRSLDLPGAANGRGLGRIKREPQVILGPAQSAELRDQLLIEVEAIASADLAANWAEQALASKNRLTESDAKLVEAAFERRLAKFQPTEALAIPEHSPITAIEEKQQTAIREPTETHRPTSIDKSVLAIAAPRRYRNREHLRYVMQQPCVICGRKPSDPHHLRYLQPRALGRKASDEFAVPLCRVHHRAAHRAGDERVWWQAAGIDPIESARKLWQETRGTRKDPPALAPEMSRAAIVRDGQ